MDKRSHRITRKPKADKKRQVAPREKGKQYRAAWARRRGAITMAPPFYEKLSDAPEALIERATLEKFAWIQRFMQEGCPRGELLDYAKAYAKARGIAERDVPKYSTLNTWAHRYAAWGMVGLIDRPRKDAGVSRTVKDEAQDAVKLAVATGRGAAATLGIMVNMVPGELPKYDAVWRELRRLEREDPLLAAMAKYGPTAFREHVELQAAFPRLLGGYRLTIDSTVADRWIKVPDGNGGWVAKRPVLTVIEDVGSRLLVTFNLSLELIDSGICTAVLGRAVDQRLNYPGLLSVGVPYEITLDKGSEHQRLFKAALKRLRIDIVRRNPNSPRGGAHVERAIGTITTEVFANRIGYSKCERIINPYAPAADDTKRNAASLKYEPYKLDLPVSALCTLSDLELEILGWARVYNARPHPGLEVGDPDLQSLLRSVASVAQRRSGGPASEVA